MVFNKIAHIECERNLMDARQAAEVTPQPEKKIKLFLDIDKCLAVYFQINEDHWEYMWCSVLERNDLCIFALKHHYFILPGVKEFLTLICQRIDIELAFFSAAPADRNKAFVLELFKLTFGPEDYLNKFANIKIFSSNDLVPSEHSKKDKEQSDTFDISTYTFRKKLPVRPEALEWTVLVDDLWPAAYYGEEKNLLKMPGCETEHFRIIYESFYDKKGKGYGVDYDRSYAAVNQIFFMTGLFFTALERARQTNSTLATALFNLQFRAKYEYNELRLFHRYAAPFGKRYLQSLAKEERKPYKEIESEKRAFEEKGLQLLLAVNPRLKRLDMGSFLDATERVMHRPALSK